MGWCRVRGERQRREKEEKGGKMVKRKKENYVNMDGCEYNNSSLSDVHRRWVAGRVEGGGDPLRWLSSPQ